MSTYSIALRYDKSLLQLATEQGVLEEVNNDMVMLINTINQNKMLALMLKNPVIGYQKKLSVLQAIFKNKANKLTLSFLEMLVRKNRVNILKEIAQVFHEQYNAQKGIVGAEIITQYPIDEKERLAFKAIVKQHTGAKDVELTELVDTEIIGGFILKVGDKQIDSSLRSKLKELKIKFES